VKAAMPKEFVEEEIDKAAVAVLRWQISLYVNFFVIDSR
jgi:hypothetical protein